MRIFGPVLLAALAISGAFAQSAPDATQPAAPDTQATAPSTPKASPPQVTSIILEDYGEFSAVAKASSKSTGEGIPFTAVTNVRLAKKTRTIMIHKSVNFGYHYQAVGSPRGEKATLHFVVIYPPPGVTKPGSSTPIARDEFDRKVRIGVKGSFNGYELDNDWEMVPGNWTLEIWSGPNRLASENFNLVKQ